MGSFLAVGELAGRAGAVEHAFAAGEILRLTRGLAGFRGAPMALAQMDFAVEGFSSRYWLSPSATAGLDLPSTSGIAELVLGLALELGVEHLDADDRGQALADVVAGGRQRSP